MRPEAAFPPQIRPLIRRCVESDSVLFSFGHDSTGWTGVVDEAVFGCGRTHPPVARIPQIKSLCPRTPGHPPGLQAGFEAPTGRGPGRRVCTNEIKKTEVETACPCSRALSIPEIIL